MLTNKTHKLIYHQLGDTITDTKMVDELIKIYEHVDYGYTGNLYVPDILNWLYSLKKRII